MPLKQINTGTSKVASGYLATLPNALSITFPGWMLEKYPDILNAQNSINKFSQDVVSALSSLSTRINLTSSEQESTSSAAGPSSTINDEALLALEASLDDLKSKYAGISQSISAIKGQVGSDNSSVQSIQNSIKSIQDQIAHFTESKTYGTALAWSQKLLLWNNSSSSEPIDLSQTAKLFEIQTGDILLVSRDGAVPSRYKIETATDNSMGLMSSDHVSKLQQNSTAISGLSNTKANWPTGIAAMSLSGHRAMTFDANDLVTYAQPGDLVAGITEHSYATADTVTMRNFGIITESSWTWTAGGTVFLAADGIPTQTVPTSGFLQVLGRAVTSKSMLISIQPTISLV